MPTPRRRSATPTRRLPVLPAVAFALLVVLAGAGLWYAARPGPSVGEVTRDRYGDLVQTVRAGQVPVFAQEAGAEAVAAYRFASSEEGKALESVPCYCGCRNIGHRHNRDCYIKGTGAGTVTFTSHGAT